mmetsp:Transcript_69469/g.182071  ORF Transcript_69469/g.182071 Transcript_69469/m.182071 type:complete len:212 (+) Transcript_69469:575-1210(+)
MDRAGQQGQQGSGLLHGEEPHRGLELLPWRSTHHQRRSVACLLQGSQVPHGLVLLQEPQLLPGLARPGLVDPGGAGVRASRRPPGLGAVRRGEQGDLRAARRGLGLGRAQPLGRLHGVVGRLLFRLPARRGELGLRWRRQERRLRPDQPRGRPRRQRMRREAPLRVQVHRRPAAEGRGQAPSAEFWSRRGRPTASRGRGRAGRGATTWTPP